MTTITFAGDRVGHARIVARSAELSSIREMVRNGPAYEYAATRDDRRTYEGGRLPAYGIPLPFSGARVVVRRSFHGGLLARWMRDLFLPPTRALRELRTSVLLERFGIRTPSIVGIVIYSVGGLFRRSDVISTEIPHANNLADELKAARWAPDAIALAVGTLVRRLSEHGAWHPDLNLRNVLVAPTTDGTPEALILDVDRVHFVSAGDPHVLPANLERLERSIRKFRARGGTTFEENDLASLRRFALPATG